MQKAARKRTGKRYSLKIERNLMNTYLAANEADHVEGILWYREAHKIAASIEGVTLQQSAGVIAALSPGRDWDANVQDARVFISAWVKGLRGSELPVVGTYGRQNVQKAVRILEGENPLDVLGGNKVRSFYSNILDPDCMDYVTVDRHAKCCAMGLKNAENSIVKDSEYNYLADHFRKCAERLNLTPNQFQAVVWIAWRRLKGQINLS